MWPRNKIYFTWQLTHNCTTQYKQKFLQWQEENSSSTLTWKITSTIYLWNRVSKEFDIAPNTESQALQPKSWVLPWIANSFLNLGGCTCLFCKQSTRKFLASHLQSEFCCQIELVSYPIHISNWSACLVYHMHIWQL
jgi:hypothetical protein